MAERIAIVGISGAGKSTFARALARRTGLPLRHGDLLDWLPDWAIQREEDLVAMHERWLAEPRWIIEGWIDQARARRLALADLVIDLDISRWRCFARVLSRMLAHRHREEMPEGCVDRFSLRTLKWVLFKDERPFVDGALKAAAMKSYLRFTSTSEANAWLESLQAQSALPSLSSI
jgi:adenylate kinase family enzyme